MKTTLLQTLEDRNNNEYIKKNAPFECTRQDAWLGRGCYFWEFFECWAHFWGNVSYDGKYIIFKIECSVLENELFDLVGRMEHLDILSQYYNALKGKYHKDFTIAEVIQHMKLLNFFTYKAIRIRGESVRQSHKNRIHFNLNPDKKSTFFTKRPQVQWCIINNDILNRDTIEIIRPNEYGNEIIMYG